MQSMDPVEINRGQSPVILAMPHSGTFIPEDILALLNDRGRELADTDWHVNRLYDGLSPNATTVRATFHRYVIDANRDPSGASLYPGQNTTGLCPLTDFDGAPIYKDGCKPGESEVERRRLAFHAPYHDALCAEIDRVHAQHGVAVLYDCHSIRSQIPYLLDGALPDFNIGTNEGVTCDPEFEQAVVDICEAADGYSSVVNGRFKGGWTTRHYGDPENGVHAIQMELAQKNYMDEAPPWDYRAERAEALRSPLRKILLRLDEIARDYKA